MLKLDNKTFVVTCYYKYGSLTGNYLCIVAAQIKLYNVDDILNIQHLYANNINEGDTPNS